MASLSDAQLQAIRSWVGEEVESTLLHERFARLNDVDGVVIETLRANLADMLTRPSSMSVDGVSISWGANITALRQRIDDFINGGGIGDGTPPTGSSAPQAFQLIRHDTR